VLDDLAAIIRLGVRINLRVYTPIPGTDDFQNYRHLFADRPLEDLDSFLYPLAHEGLTTAFMESVYSLTNLQVFEKEDIAKRKDTHPLFADLLKKL